jgi:hypothetical protein
VASRAAGAGGPEGLNLGKPERFGREPVGGFSLSALSALDEVPEERRDIPLAVAQRREKQGHHPHPVAQVLAKIARPPPRGATPCWSPRSYGRRPSPSGSRRRGQRSSPASRAGACPAARGGISATSSRKRVPPCASANRPARSRRAPAKAPRTCPKSSLSSRVGGEGRAVDRLERRLPTGAFRVDRPRHQLLARPGFAPDQHRAMRRGDAAHEGERPPPSRGATL